MHFKSILCVNSLKILLIWRFDLCAYFYFLSVAFMAFTCSASLQGKRKSKKVQVGKDQEKAQSEKDSHSKNRGGKKQTNNQVLIP